MNADLKKLYMRKMKEITDRINTCDYSDNENIIDILHDLADVVKTMLQYTDCQTKNTEL